MARVDVIVVKKVKRDDADEVTVKALAGSSGEAVYVGMPLNASDEISCRDRTAKVEIVSADANGKSSRITLTGPFRVAISKPGTGGIVMDLHTGGVYVESDTPTTVRSGEKVVASEKTTYSVHAPPRGDSSHIQAIVYEGLVRVNQRGWRGSRCLSTGKKHVGNVCMQVSRICPQDYERAACVLAEVAVARETESGRAVDRCRVLRLQCRYRAALSAPHDPRRSRALRNEQARADFAAAVSRSQSDRAVDTSDAGEPQQDTPTESLFASAIDSKQSGESVRAKRSARERFERFDPSAARVSAAELRAGWSLTEASMADPFAPAQPWLFRMIKLGLRKEALVGFNMRSKLKRPDSRDLYGRGVLMQQLRDDGEGARRVLREAALLNRRQGGLNAAESAEVDALLAARR